MGPAKGSTTSQGVRAREGSVIHGRRTVAALLAAAAAGSVALVTFLYLRSGVADPRTGRVRGGCLTILPESEPRMATQLALDYLRSQYAKQPAPSSSSTAAAAPTGLSLGGLVHFLRGDPSMTFEGYKVANAHRHRVSLAYIQYVEDNYLPNSKASAEEDAKDVAQSSDVAAPPLPHSVERAIFQELVELDFGFRCLEKYRATVFNNNDRTHVNLLQQLWVAAGNPATTFQRTTAQWTDFGFQGEDPSTDLRGAGILGLRQLVHFAQTHTAAFQEMVAYNARTLAAKKDSWYLLAVVSLQMTAHLLLEKDVQLYPAHLEVLYDTLTPLSANSGNLLRGAGTTGGSGSSSAGVPRRAAAQKLGLASLADARVWQCVTKTAAAAKGSSASAGTAAPAPGTVLCGDAEAGLNALHHQLLLHFKACWERDEPHVMEYNVYTPQKVYATFFCASWKPAEVTPAKPTSQRGAPS